MDTGNGKKRSRASLAADIARELEELKELEERLPLEIRERMLVIPNIIDATVPIGKDDSENVELNVLGKHWFPILKCLITLKLWNTFRGSISTPPENGRFRFLLSAR